MKKFSLVILILLFIFSSATGFVNVCSGITSETCHKKYKECHLKSALTAVESSKIIISMPNEMVYVDTLKSEIVENQIKFISTADLSYPQGDNSCIVRSLNPANAPPLA